jgi:hypothetical protein
MQGSELMTSVDEVIAFKPIPFHQRGGRKVIIPAADSTVERHIQKPATNIALINAVAKAFYWSRLIELGVVTSGSEIAAREGLEASTVNERLRLTLLSPTIIESILNGNQPSGLTMQWLTRNSFPTNWIKQKNLVFS